MEPLRIVAIGGGTGLSSHLGQATHEATGVGADPPWYVAPQLLDREEHTGGAGRCRLFRSIHRGTFTGASRPVRPRRRDRATATLPHSLTR